MGEKVEMGVMNKQIKLRNTNENNIIVDLKTTTLPGCSNNFEVLEVEKEGSFVLSQCVGISSCMGEDGKKGRKVGLPKIL